MRILKFCTIRTVNYISNGFCLHQVHSAVQECTARVFAGLGKTHSINAFYDLNQFTHDNRIAMRIKLQNIFARVRIRTFKKNVEEAIDDLRCRMVITYHCAIVPCRCKFRFAGL